MLTAYRPWGRVLAVEGSIGEQHSYRTGARLDRMPITSFHHALALIVSTGLLVDGFDIFLTAGVAAALVREGVATLTDVAHLSITTSIGMAAGGVLTGFMADRFGRVAGMRVTILLIIAAAVGMAAAPSFNHLLAWRFLAALGLGGETVLAYGMLTEFMPSRTRGRWLAWCALLASAALPLTLGVGYFILPQPDGWRWMLFLPAIAGVGIFLLRLGLPESPRWLEVRGLHEEANAIVERVEASAKSALPPPHSVVAPDSAERSASDAIWPRLLAAIAINVASIGAVYGFVSWLPTFFVAEGHDIASSTLFSGVMASGAPLGALIVLLIGDRVERKWAAVVSSLIAVVCGVIYANATTEAEILAAGFAVVLAIYVYATLALITYVPEMFPTATRLRAIGFASAFGRAAAITMPLLVVPIFSTSGQAGVIALIASLLVGQALVVAAFGVRTSKRSLERV